MRRRSWKCKTLRLLLRRVASVSFRRLRRRLGSIRCYHSQWLKHMHVKGLLVVHRPHLRQYRLLPFVVSQRYAAELHGRGSRLSFAAGAHTRGHLMHASWCILTRWRGFAWWRRISYACYQDLSPTRFLLEPTNEARLQESHRLPSSHSEPRKDLEESTACS